MPEQRRRLQQSTTSGYVYVANHTKLNASELVVYPAGVPNASPARTISQSLVDVTGVAVDSSGNVYVANGSGGNVLEYGPGGVSLVQTYSKGLVDPVGIAVAGDTLYVADRGDAANGYLQQVLEYTLGNSTPSLGISGLGNFPQLNDAIAVNPVGPQGTFFASASSLTAIPPAGSCPAGNNDMVGESLSPTLWRIVSLSDNAQASGLAFDSHGKLYAADACGNDVAIYSNVNGTWTYSGSVGETFNAPLLLTINNQRLVVPSAGSATNPGYVTVIDLTGKTSAVTITRGLDRPVGAASSSS